MKFTEYIDNLPEGSKIRLRYSINNKEKTFGGYEVIPGGRVRPLGIDRTIHDFDNLTVKQVYPEGEYLIITLVVGTYFLKKHPKYKHGPKMPTLKFLNTEV